MLLSNLKKILKYFPKNIYAALLKVYISLHSYISYIRTLKENPYPLDILASNNKPRILFYHISGLHFAGTEKFLQILAKYIDKEKYDVYFMYSGKPRGDKNEHTDKRKNYLEDQQINLIGFGYDELEQSYPYYIKNMSPHILEIIQKYSINLIVTAGAGYPEYPTNIIKNIPIVFLNIFGSPNLQKNVTSNVCISQEVASKIQGLVPSEKIHIMYIQSEKPLLRNETRKKLREKFNILDTDFVFGRIGRPDNNIFDPIGIRAFQKAVQKYPETHYIIMAPPPILVEIVEKENIPNVHFLPPSAREEDVWAFHSAIDALAHFRHDGESFGLNIAESMLAGNPIITHKSHIWNAHLEYLEPSFSRVAEKDNVDQYASYMEEMIQFKKEGGLKKLGDKAQEKAEKLFLMKNNIARFEQWVDQSLIKKHA